MKKRILLILLSIISLLSFSIPVYAEGDLPSSYNLADHCNIRVEIKEKRVTVGHLRH